jgi:hypothetical protein
MLDVNNVSPDVLLVGKLVVELTTLLHDVVVVGVCCCCGSLNIVSVVCLACGRPIGDTWVLLVASGILILLDI